jgi:hypothetical protein
MSTVADIISFLIKKKCESPALSEECTPVRRVSGGGVSLLRWSADGARLFAGTVPSYPVFRIRIPSILSLSRKNRKKTSTSKPLISAVLRLFMALYLWGMMYM